MTISKVEVQKKPLTCLHDPMQYLGQPIGQYHCPGCGVMLLAGMPHPEVCDCAGYADYKGLCPNCNPNFEEDMKGILE